MAGSSKDWVVLYDPDAVVDFERVKGVGERRAVLLAVEKLAALGPELTSPHLKSLKGAADLFELRPRRGRSPVRAIYARSGDRFVILAVAAKKNRLGVAVADAGERLKRYRRG